MTRISVVQFCSLLSVIVDAGSGCQSVTFTINDSTTTSRSWDIKTTQYACGDSDTSGLHLKLHYSYSKWPSVSRYLILGPPGCLQYYKDTYGVIQSFNFPTGSTVGSSGR